MKFRRTFAALLPGVLMFVFAGATAPDCNGEVGEAEKPPVLEEVEVGAPFPVLDENFDVAESMYKSKEVRLIGDRLHAPGTDLDDVESINRDVKVWWRWSEFHSFGLARVATGWAQAEILSVSDHHIDVKLPRISHMGAIELQVEVIFRGKSNVLTLRLDHEPKDDNLPQLKRITVHSEVGDLTDLNDNWIPAFGSTPITFEGTNLTPPSADGNNFDQKVAVQWRQIQPSRSAWQPLTVYAFRSDYLKVNPVVPNQTPMQPGVVEFRVVHHGVGYSNVIAAPVK